MKMDFKTRIFHFCVVNYVYLLNKVKANSIKNNLSLPCSKSYIIYAYLDVPVEKFLSGLKKSTI